MALNGPFVGQFAGTPNRTQAQLAQGFLQGLVWVGDESLCPPDGLLECVNLDVDESGALVPRKPWTTPGQQAFDAVPYWQPLNAGAWHQRVKSYMWQATPLSQNATSCRIMIYGGMNEDGDAPMGWLKYSDDESFVNVSGRAGADATPWNWRLYISPGVTNNAQQPVKLDDEAGIDAESGVVLGTRLLVAHNGYNDDYSNPTTGRFVVADTVATHMGYVFGGCVRETGDTILYNRLRWSHPNQPESWHSKDYIDEYRGGERITCVRSFEDHLVVFKDQSIWALHGYDSTSWEWKNVTMDFGVASPMAVIDGGGYLWFVNEQGVFRYSFDGIEKVSYKIDALFNGGLQPFLVNPYTSSDENMQLADEYWSGLNGTSGLDGASGLRPDRRYVLSWVNGRLWLSTGWKVGLHGRTDASGTGPNHNPYPCVWVYNPKLDTWTVYHDGEGGVGRVVWLRNTTWVSQGAGDPGQGDRYVAFRSRVPILRIVEDPTLVRRDSHPGGAPTFWARTAWFYAGNPSLSKRWRRADVLMGSQAAQIAYGVCHGLRSRIVRRGHVRSPNLSAAGAVDMGVSRTAQLGNASAVSLLFRARDAGFVQDIHQGSQFRLAQIIFKFVARRLK